MVRDDKFFFTCADNLEIATNETFKTIGVSCAILLRDLLYPYRVMGSTTTPFK